MPDVSTSASQRSCRFILIGVLAIFSHRAAARLPHCGLDCRGLNNASAAAVRASCCHAATGATHGSACKRHCGVQLQQCVLAHNRAGRGCVLAVHGCAANTRCCYVLQQCCMLAHGCAANARCCYVLQRCVLAHGRAANTKCCCVLQRCVLAHGRAADTSNAGTMHGAGSPHHAARTMLVEARAMHHEGGAGRHGGAGRGQHAHVGT